MSTPLKDLYGEGDLSREGDETWFDKWMDVCVCVFCVSVYALSGVTPLSQVLRKQHMEVKQCSTVWFLPLKVTKVI